MLTPSPVDPAQWRQPGETGYSDALLQIIADRFHLLGEPLRLKILAALSQGEHSVGDLVTLTGSTQPNCSKHLQILARGGLVQRRKVGTSILYSVADPTIYRLCDLVCGSVQARIAAQANSLGIHVGTLPPTDEFHET